MREAKILRLNQTTMNKASETASGDELAFIVQLHLKPERVDEWKRAVVELIDRMSEEEAFVTCLLDQSTEDPNMFTLYERWREPSLEAFVKNQMKDYRKCYEEMLPDLLQVPRKAMVLRPIHEWHR
jgi:quinol monooxygenase YgiN